MPDPYNNCSRARHRSPVQGNPYDWDYKPYRAPYGADYWHTHAYTPSYWKNRYSYGVEGYSNEPNYWSFSEFWKTPGPYSGRGPKNYRRSDDVIHRDVCERLAGHGQLDAGGIEVDVHNGEVTLNGAVDNRRDKRLAEDIAD